MNRLAPAIDLMPRPRPPRVSAGFQPVPWRPVRTGPVQRRRLPERAYRGKAVLDVLAAAVLLVAAAPVIVAAGVLVGLTSRGPAVYSQRRLGRGGRPFVMYKLRTMR